jgi:hypothetical protein
MSFKKLDNYIVLDPDRVRLYRILLSSTPYSIKNFNNLLESVRNNLYGILNAKNEYKELSQKIRALGACSNDDKILCKSLKKVIENKIKERLNLNKNTKKFEDFNSYYKGIFQGGSKIDNKFTLNPKILNIIDKYIGDIQIDINTLIKKYDYNIEEIRNTITMKGGGINLPQKEYIGKDIKDLEDFKYQLKYNEFFGDSELKTQDVIMFSVVIFFIRIISLMIVRLAIDINMLHTFEHILIFYIALYIIFLGIIYALVNIEYDIGNSFSLLKQYLYYFYFEINGYYRFILHLSILFIILLIPFIIKIEEDKAEDSYIENDLRTKRNIYKEISNFSLILWVFLTIIALIIK